MSSVGSTRSRVSLRIRASRKSSCRSPPARSTYKRAGKIGGGSSRAADELDSLLDGMQDEPESSRIQNIETQRCSAHECAWYG
jgi:hypothetical protein